MERLKINQNIIIDEVTINEMIKTVFDNQKCLKYLFSLGLDERLIKDNITKVYDLAIDMANCKGCKGIKYCNKDPKYLVSSVNFKNGSVDREIVPCKKYLEFVNFKTKFKMLDFEESWLDNQINRDVQNKEAKGQKEALTVFKEHISSPDNGKWLYLMGEIASGKSFLAATMAVVGARNNVFSSICFINVPARFKMLADYAFTKNPQFDEDLEKLKSCDLLVLDDFGNEFKSDFVRDNILFPLISARVREKKFTIITSNYSMEDIATMYQTTKASLPKINQIKSMLKLACSKEIKISNPSNL